METDARSTTFTLHHAPRSGYFPDLYLDLCQELYISGQDQDVGEWQSLQGTPLDETREILHTRFEYCMPPKMDQLQEEVQPNLPWAEAQFKERVAGEPLNPGKTYKDWPWYKGNVETHQTQEEKKFSHTYMERFWPRHAGDLKVYEETQDGVYPAPSKVGIRFEYGDLGNLLHMLLKRPNTRQAYLPIWFPEDLHAADVEQERVPCTLGYHFIRRNGKLDITYFIRSCDLFRHFKDDVYMACRLCQWVLEALQNEENRPAADQWTSVCPGSLLMDITSLHVFKGDLPKLKKEAQL